MKRLTCITIFLILSFNCFSQDSIIVIQKKGFLFLSKYTYSENNKYPGEIKDLGFNDFFFPANLFSEKLFADSNLFISFKNGIRIEEMPNRNEIKKAAVKVYGTDSSLCYKNDIFYIVPVIVEGKIYTYNFEDCRRNYFELQIKNGSKVRFEYLQKAILPRRITPILPLIEKKKMNE
jgi:hypothetical protein